MDYFLWNKRGSTAPDETVNGYYDILTTNCAVTLNIYNLSCFSGGAMRLDVITINSFKMALVDNVPTYSMIAHTEPIMISVYISSDFKEQLNKVSTFVYRSILAIQDQEAWQDAFAKFPFCVNPIVDQQCAKGW